MDKQDRVRQDYRQQRIREVEVQIQRLFTPVQAPDPKERCIVVRTVGNTRLIRRVIES